MKYRVNIEYSQGSHQTDKKAAIARVCYPDDDPRSAVDGEYRAVLSFDNAKASLFPQSQITFRDGAAGFKASKLEDHEKFALVNSLHDFWSLPEGIYELNDNGKLEELVLAQPSAVAGASAS